ncbi:MAG: hypothetical protein K9K38_07380 [Rhodoferax sp.]|nr:hypothetical protein [Rhodoferax sp.]
MATKKFAVGEWVEYEDIKDPLGEKRLGMVTKVPRGDIRSVTVRWVRNCHQGGKYAASILTHRLPIPMVLEGNLAADLHEPRTEYALLRNWFDSITCDFVFKSVHQLSDIELLAKKVNHAILPPFIHISCHGDFEDSDDLGKRPFIQLLDDKLYLDDPYTIEVFSKFEGYPVFFSACFLGRFKDPILAFQKAAKLGPILASVRKIYDNEAMLFGLMLYQSVIMAGIPFGKAAHNCIAALHKIGIKGEQGHALTYARCWP